MAFCFHFLYVLEELGFNWLVKKKERVSAFVLINILFRKNFSKKHFSNCIGRHRRRHKESHSQGIANKWLRGRLDLIYSKNMQCKPNNNGDILWPKQKLGQRGCCVLGFFFNKKNALGGSLQLCLNWCCNKRPCEVWIIEIKCDWKGTAWILGCKQCLPWQQLQKQRLTCELTSFDLESLEENKCETPQCHLSSPSIRVLNQHPHVFSTGAGRLGPDNY